MMFGVFFFFVILASLLVLWRWRADDCMLPWKKVVAVCGICSVILFPLGLVFRADGLYVDRMPKQAKRLRIRMEWA